MLYRTEVLGCVYCEALQEERAQDSERAISRIAKKAMVRRTEEPEI
jgi:predicted adenine nucleotide alpha hydrolase (AANH) superfamily ATPase